MTPAETRLQEYIEDWNAIEGEKPCNEPAFISDFIEFVKVLDGDCVTFNGAGAYFGKQLVVQDLPNHCFPTLGFEIAYDADHIRVYTDRHNGFWVPEFISIFRDNPDFKPVAAVIKLALLKTIAIPESY